MKIYKKTIFLLVSIVIMLFIGRMVVSNSISTSGTQLGDMNEQISKYETENSILSEKVLNLSSLTNVYEKAEKLGFLSEKTTFSITNSLPVAIKQ